MRKKQHLSFFLVVLLSVLFLDARSETTETAGSPNRVTPVVLAVRKVMPTVTNISTERVVRVSDPFEQFFSNFFGPHAQYMKESIPLGSGIVVSPFGLVVTNDHVTRRASTIQVRLLDGSSYTAKAVAFDRANDICLLQLEGDFTEKPLQAVEFALPEDLLLGETVVTVGNPFGLEHSVARGVLSAKNRSLRESNVVFNDILQTDAAINPGNSGGPLINLDGNLIGMNLAIRRDAEGIGFAIPLKRIEDVLSQWMIPARFSLARIGVLPTTVLTDTGAALVAAQVQTDGPAAAAGLKNGDRIVSINKTPVTRAIDYGRLLWQTQPGDNVQLGLADGRKLSFKAEKMGSDALVRQRLGIRVQELSTPLKKALGLADELRGLAITEILPGSEFDRQQLRWGEMVRRGDILVQMNGTDIGTLTDLFDLLKGTRSGDSVSVILLAVDSIGDQLSIAPIRVHVTLH